ncbi:hypothetical protein DMB65_09805 [Flavobacterium cheongpyeongense]|uniref:Methylamine utilisation protein MauE domain-containing protein n=1 Tax=Flavobacterium cheongpyeongense TaxID=2212651 RepID=A0A2V4BPD2_9FLAO|nr:MauE/DoxX family redox-associated membrane protein [Flavobacterium cheongpyeongense]PXY40866.1 hypothetical protein DMB65_09805 [Flavobacterium cheongpyeongense]
MILYTNAGFKKYAIDVICLLYILLFVYAAVSKLLDFENFQVQLGQSPTLSSYALWISYLVPLIELLIALFLIIPKLRNCGLYSALCLMTMFTTYIFIVLHYSSFVPCSCGGILEKMSWNVHLAFNLFFVVLAITALIWQSQQPNNNAWKKKPRTIILKISLSFILSVIAVTVLFLLSEEIMQYKNPFIRRFPQHPVMRDTVIDLKFNSYYFAGADQKRIYLGNYSNPLHVKVLNEKTKIIETTKITFAKKNIPFVSVRTVVRGSHFYLTDGSVPAIFKGRISDWKTTGEFKGLPYFTLAEPVDSTKVILRSSRGKNRSHELGIFDDGQIQKIRYNKTLLQVQKDGIFDTDGTLAYSEKLHQLVYTYYYRNEFIVVNSNAELSYIGNTIDTTTKAKIKVAYLKNGMERKFSAPPLTVNAKTAVCGNLLFVNSRVQGRFENEKLWKDAFIIDVYNLVKRTYIMSFAVYKIEEKKLFSFYVTDDYLYAIMENHLAVYKLRNNLKKEMKIVK